MAAEINKAVIPEDYARLIYSKTNAPKLGTTSMSVHELTEIDISNLPEYDMVGEIEYIYTKGSADDKLQISQNRKYNSGSIFIINSEILSKYRFIRLILQPNFYFTVTYIPPGTYTNLGYAVEIRINDLDGATYRYPKGESDVILVATINKTGIVENTNKLALIFDTKTKEFVRDTKSTELWSSIYTPISINAEEES